MKLNQRSHRSNLAVGAAVLVLAIASGARADVRCEGLFHSASDAGRGADSVLGRFVGGVVSNVSGVRQHIRQLAKEARKLADRNQRPWALLANIRPHLSTLNSTEVQFIADEMGTRALIDVPGILTLRVNTATLEQADLARNQLALEYFNVKLGHGEVSTVDRMEADVRQMVKVLTITTKSSVQNRLANQFLKPRLRGLDTKQVEEIAAHMDTDAGHDFVLKTYLTGTMASRTRREVHQLTELMNSSRGRAKVQQLMERTLSKEIPSSTDALLEELGNFESDALRFEAMQNFVRTHASQLSAERMIEVANETSSNQEFFTIVSIFMETQSRRLSVDEIVEIAGAVPTPQATDAFLLNAARKYATRPTIDDLVGLAEATSSGPAQDQMLIEAATRFSREWSVEEVIILAENTNSGPAQDALLIGFAQREERRLNVGQLFELAEATNSSGADDTIRNMGLRR